MANVELSETKNLLICTIMEQEYTQLFSVQSASRTALSVSKLGAQLLLSLDLLFIDYDDSLSLYLVFTVTPCSAMHFSMPLDSSDEQISDPLTLISRKINSGNGTSTVSG